MELDRSLDWRGVEASLPVSDLFIKTGLPPIVTSKGTPLIDSSAFERGKPGDCSSPSASYG